jgi:SAM-dependent methyltransferase
MADYSARYLEQYAAESFETVLVAVRRAEVLAALARYPHRHVLEVGCGLEPLFAHATGWEAFTVVEPSAEFVARARSLAEGRPGVTVVQDYFETAQPRLAGPAPDLVVVSSLLHEVPDPAALLAALRACAAEQTVVHLNVPNMRSFHRLLAFEMGVIDSLFEPSELERRFQRRTRYDAAALRDAVETAGFRVLREGSYFVKPFTHAQMEALRDAGVLDARMLQGLGRMVRHLPGLGCEIYVDLVRA